MSMMPLLPPLPPTGPASDPASDPASCQDRPRELLYGRAGDIIGVNG